MNGSEVCQIGVVSIYQEILASFILAVDLRDT